MLMEKERINMYNWKYNKKHPIIEIIKALNLILFGISKEWANLSSSNSILITFDMNLFKVLQGINLGDKKTLL